MTVRQVVLRAISEKDFQNTVRSLALANKWLYYHVFDSRKSAPGFPDCVMVRDGHLIFAELKTEKGRVTKAQNDWLAALYGAGDTQVYVWRPSDLPEIERILREGS